jgi:hypothetical protein
VISNALVHASANMHSTLLGGLLNFSAHAQINHMLSVTRFIIVMGIKESKKYSNDEVSAGQD